MAKRNLSLGLFQQILKYHFVVFVLAFLLIPFLINNPVSATATQSTITMSTSDDVLPISITPTASGAFGKTTNNTITVSTDNYTGYTLSVSSETSTYFRDGNTDVIPSINTNIDETTFTNNSTYNNKWGYKPSQYITTNNNINTVVQNSDYLPAPSLSGDLLAVTDTKNTTADTYTLSFGARVDLSLAAGTYTYTYIVAAVANSIVYNVTYDANAGSDTVTNMPVPNPQPTTIDGGTPVADSYVTLSDAVPVRNDKKFAGWCDVATTTDQTTGDDTCSGTTYNPGDNLPVDQTAAPNITLYAIWVETLFPIVWNQMGACEFHGSGDFTGNDLPYNITGSECQDYWDVPFIDTKIPLYSATNASKDFEIHFKIDHYAVNEQVDNDSQQTFVNAKVSSTATSSTIASGEAPGLVVRRAANNVEFNSKLNDDQVRPYVTTNSLMSGGGEVSVFRLDNKIYYSVNGGPLVLLQDITGFDQYFGLTTWFGAYPSDSCTGDNGLCTGAKRFIEATLSNMYIKLGQYSDDDVHTINFKKNNGTTDNETTYLIEDGNSITTLPAAPTYADHLFQGWFTAQSGGTQVTTSTVPTASADYYAHWLGTMAVADVTTAQIALQPGNSETIVIANSSELEPYTFSSSNSGVASVNTNTGEVTAVAAGSATITITGTISGETKTVPVTVAGQVYQVYFDSQGGSAVSPNPIEVGDGGSIDPLPTSIKANSELEGWYTLPNGDGTKLLTSTIFDSNTPTQYYANWLEITYVCRPATVLHTETCNRSNGGCRGAGYNYGAKLTYGSLVQQGATSLVGGNAMTCDIDADGIFDEENERFYYITTVGNNAALLYYKNISDAENLYDPALALLPTSSTTGWTNPHLVTFGAGDYNGKNARFMSYEETVATCNNTTNYFGTNGKCQYILEKSNFAQTTIRDGYWIGKANHSTRVHTGSRNISDGSTANGVRPMIEVPMEYVSIHVHGLFNIVFEPHNGENSTTALVDEGDPLGSKLPANPTYTDHLFQGWFTAQSGGTQINTNTVPSGDTTYHAQWLKTVALAELARDTIAVEPSETANIIVTNSAELEPYTFSSANSSIATVNQTTGVITGVANGTTTITMTGTTSGATKTITVNVTTLLPVTQAIIANNDLTVPVTEQITIIVSNAGELENYTFSSADTSVATVNELTGVITGVNVGTTNIIMTGTKSGLTKSLEVSVIVEPAVVHNVTFEANGGSFSNQGDGTKQVEDGTALGATPTPTKTNYMFFGWYKDDNTFYEEVYPEEIIEDDVTYYAKWIENTSSFPIEFAEINKCVFTGTSVTGDYCNHTSNNYYIDSDVQLFTSANYTKEFEIGFNIVEYNPNHQINISGDTGGLQATFVNSKKEDSANNYPGFVVRRNTTNIQLTARWKGDSNHAVTMASTVHSIKVSRKKETTQSGTTYKLYYTVDGVESMFQDITDKAGIPFDTEVWFGGATAANGTSPMRPLVAELTDMYVKLGARTDYIINFNANHGALQTGEESRTITIGSQIGTLPVPTPPDSNFTFVGWFDESVTPNVQISAATVPSSDKTYVAHYQYQSSDTPVEFDISNEATRDYNTLINSWIQSPINISTFNTATPINNSTWGDTSELSEAGFWTGLKNNFESNDCLVPTYKDTATTTPNPSNWSSGTIDCGKPDAYNTKVGAALNVYLDNKQGELVTYADASSGIIHNMIPGQTYYWERADDSTVYGYVTAVSNTNYSTRWVDTGIIRNTRDLGGLPVTYTDGNNQTVTGTLAYGRLFRGEKLWNASATELTKLGINKEYDVGNPSEYAGNTQLPDYVNDEVIHYNFDYNTGDELNNTSNYMRAWLAVTHIMQDITNTSSPKNIYFHCRVGSDRTGTVAYLLEGLLGVPDEARYQEYELTHLSGQWDRTRYYKQKTSTNNLKFVFMMEYVKTNADILAWYMKNPNYDMNLVQAFRAAMTVTNSNQQQNSPQNNSLNSAGRGEISLNSNNTNVNSSNNEENESNEDNNTYIENGQSSYSEPLGVTNNSKPVDPLVDPAPIAAAAVVVATGAAISYAAAKSNNTDENG